MKSFFEKYSYGMIKMFVNQFAISIFGSVIAMATTAADNQPLTLVVSIFAIVFYLFLIYTMTWEIGAKDRISVDVGKKEYRPFTGLIMSLVANIPNFLIALLFTVAYPFMSVQTWAGNMAAVLKLIAIVTEGMYLGLITTATIGTSILANYWWTYFLITVPALITSFLAYYLGHKNFRFTALILKQFKTESKK